MLTRSRIPAIYLVVALCLASLLGSFVYAQAATPTRTTTCNAATPWNAVCIEFVPPTKYVDGTDIVGDPLTVKVERASSATGTYSAQASTNTATTAYVTGLAAGLHYFRVVVRSSVYMADSAPSNVASKGLTSGVPNPPTITIAVLIEPGNQPVVMELTAKRDGDYRCRVLASPKGLRLKSACQAEVG